MSLGNSLLHLRQAKNLTLEEVGNCAGIAGIELSRIEDGEIDPTIETVASIAKALDVRLTSIFHGLEGTEAAAVIQCPVSSLGSCIGEQIRNQQGFDSAGNATTYGEEELHLLRMTEFIATHGSKDVRRSLAVVLESLMNHTVKSSK